MQTDAADRTRGYLGLARAYADAARQLCKADPLPLDCRPFYALAAHGLELAYKGLLARSGWDEERLMLLGHDLDRCRDHAHRAFPVLDELCGSDLGAVVERLSFSHAAQSFRYPQYLRAEMPDREDTIGCIERLVDVVLAATPT